jgi:hypothetical protein
VFLGKSLAIILNDIIYQSFLISMTIRKRGEKMDEKVLQRIKELEDELSELKGTTISTVEIELPIYSPTKIASFEPRKNERIVKILIVTEKNVSRD